MTTNLSQFSSYHSLMQLIMSNEKKKKKVVNPYESINI